MKRILMKLLVGVALLAACWRAEASGTWSPLTNPAPVSFSNCLVLSDGTLICANGGGAGGNAWYRLTPDSRGSYVNGTWSQIASMNNTRLYYSVQVLTDGRVYVAGGENGTGHDTAETYNPLTNIWTLTSPSPLSVISDAISALLPNGDVLQSNSGSSVAIYHPATDTWSSAAAPGNQNEADWVKLPDDSILTIIAYGLNAQRYIPSQNQWVSEPSVPVAMYNNEGELGSGHLLPNGKVFWLGGTGNTVIYTPTGNTNPGSWVAGPVIPNGSGANDAPAAMMANGKILCACCNSTTTFGTKTLFYEYDYTTNSFTQIPDPNHTADLSDPTQAFATSMLDLPNGSVLYCGANSKIYIYTPDGTQLTAGKPVITSVAKNADGSYHLIGTGLTGLSEGAKYGDDKQMRSNYPIVHLTDNTTGNVYYARTYNWTSTGVMTGSKVITTEFKLPAGLPNDPYSLVVSANGLVSAPVSFSPVEGPFGGTPAAIPGTVQAENYDVGGQGVAYNIGSINGTDNGYRSDGVDLEVTSDTGGGVDLGWTFGGDWFKYTVNVATAGTYTVSFRVAGGAGAVTDAFHLSNSSGTNLSGNVNVPNTGGWQTWTTVTANVTLPAGRQILTLNQDNGGWNINYATFALSGGGGTEINDTDPGITYTGSWSYSASRGLGDFQDDVHYTTTNGDSMSYTFNGTGIAYITEKEASEGNVDVYLDGVYQTTVNCTNSTRLPQQTLYSVAGLASGSHTLKLVKKDASFMVVDALVYQGATTTVATPTFSPGGGSYTSAQNISISCATSGASIRYTLDGSTPSETAGTLYSGPVNISSTATLKAIAYKSGSNDSAIASTTYTISTSQTFTITASAGSGGSISPSGSIVVNKGASQSFTITANSGNTISSVTVDGANQGAISSYTFSNVQANHTISAAFTGSNRTLTGSSGNGWHALAISPAATGTFTATYDAKPSISPENALVGLSNGAATAFGNLGCIARFNPSGDIDAYNGTAYAAASTIPYSANVSYHFRLVVNVTAHTYSVFVTPAGGSELTVGSNYAFRSTANTMTSLNDWNLFVDSSIGGASLTANNLNP
jgi:hypothetical protein